MNTDRCDHKVKKFFPYSFSLFHFLLPSLHLPRSSFITDHLSPYHLLLPSLLLITFSLLLTPFLLTTYYFSPYSLFS